MCVSCRTGRIAFPSASSLVRIEPAQIATRALQRATALAPAAPSLILMRHPSPSPPPLASSPSATPPPASFPLLVPPPPPLQPPCARHLLDYGFRGGAGASRWIYNCDPTWSFRRGCSFAPLIWIRSLSVSIPFLLLCRVVVSTTVGMTTTDALIHMNMMMLMSSIMENYPRKSSGLKVIWNWLGCLRSG